MLLGLGLTCDLIFAVGNSLLPVVILVLSRWAYHFPGVRWLGALFGLYTAGHVLTIWSVLHSNLLLLLLAKLVILNTALATPWVFCLAWGELANRLECIRQADSPRELLLEARRLRKELRGDT